jgi:hypothetical protein
MNLKQMTSTAVENESQSEDIKPADSSVLPLPSKEPLVQATLSSMFKKAEEKKVKQPRRGAMVQW